MADQRYDAVFLGNSLTSLAAAALLAKKGRRVFLLDDLDRRLSHIPDPAFEFSSGPLLYFGFERWGAMEGFFAELDFPIPMLQKRGLDYKRCAPLLQVIQPAHRIDLYSAGEDYLDELKREYGNQVQKLKILFEQAEREAAGFYPFLGQFQQIEINGMGDRLGEWRKQLDFSKAVRTQQKTSAADFLSQYVFSSSLRKYFELLSLFAYKKPFAELNAFDLILLLSALQKGGARLTGGYPKLVAFFHQLIKGWGGVVFQNNKPSAFERKGRTITCLRLPNGNRLSAPQYILSKPESNVIPDFFFSLPQELLPMPMKESLIMAWGDQRPAGFSDLMVLRLNLPEDALDQDDATRRIAVSVFPVERRKALLYDRTSLEAKILERLYWLIPFSQSKIATHAANPLRETAPFEEAYIFDSMRSGDTSEIKTKSSGDRKALLKGVSYYLRSKESKNLMILSSDLCHKVAWGSAFVAGKRLATLIENL